MKLRISIILGTLALALCLVSVVVIISSGLQSAKGVRLVLRGFQTNSAGTVCSMVAVTNGNKADYAISFAAQTRFAQTWTDPSMADPSLYKAFNTYGAVQLQPESARDFLVPVPPTGAPWRIVGAYWELPPADGIRKYWWNVRWGINLRRSYFMFVTSPEAESNPQGGANGMQSFSPETNQISAAAASRRSP